jgi:hypothetical protein
MIQLTEEQGRELVTSIPMAIDPRTRQVYVLVRKEDFDRMRGVGDEDDVQSMAPLLADLDPEDWEDASAYEGRP